VVNLEAALVEASLVEDPAGTPLVVSGAPEPLLSCDEQLLLGRNVWAWRSGLEEEGRRFFERLHVSHVQPSELSVFSLETETFELELVRSTRHSSPSSFEEAPVWSLCTLTTPSFLPRYCVKTMPPVRSLEKRAVDNLIDQLLHQVGEDARIVGAGGALSVLDCKYVGTVKQMLVDAIPNIPEQLLSSVRDDLIVVTRAVEDSSSLVSFGPSTMRLARAHSTRAEELRGDFGDLLNVEIEPSRYLETDLSDAHLVFNELFFAERSLKSWGKVTRHLARLVGWMEELQRRSGLKTTAISHGRSDKHSVYTRFETRHGEEVSSPF